MLKQKHAKTRNSNFCATHLIEIALFKLFSTESGKQFQSALSMVNCLLLIVPEGSTKTLLIREKFLPYISEKRYQNTKLFVLLEMVFAFRMRLKSVLVKLAGRKSACPISSKN